MNEGAKVDLAVAGKFHAYHLATALSSLSRLRELYAVHRTLGPPLGVPKRSFHNRFDLAYWGALSRFASLGYSTERKGEMFDDWLVRKLADKQPGVLHSWNGNSHTTFGKLKGTGWRLCLERSCPHNQFQFDLLVEEGKALDVPHKQNLRALERAIEELYLADIIVAPSSYSAASYKDPELIRKVRVNPLGANIKYVERLAKASSSLKVLLVGNNFLRKGTHYLIEAFKQIDDPKAELWLRGDVPQIYRSRISDSRVQIIPPVLPAKLDELYRTADVFVQPSIDEGFGMTVFEALGYGLPLVVTENVGAKDLLTPEVAMTVPIRDPSAIASAIVQAARLPGATFDRVRKSILQKNTWTACAQRMLEHVYAN